MPRMTRSFSSPLALSTVVLLGGCYDLSLGDYASGDAGTDSASQVAVDQASVVDTDASVPDGPEMGGDTFLDANPIVAVDAFVPDATVLGVDAYADGKEASGLICSVGLHEDGTGI